MLSINIDYSYSCHLLYDKSTLILMFGAEQLKFFEFFKGIENYELDMQKRKIAVELMNCS